MAHTTKSLATELDVSERQVLNYKKTVETHLGCAITFQKGRSFFYFDEYVPFLRMVQEGQPLPEVQRDAPIEVETLEPPQLGGGQLILRTLTVDAPEPIETVPLTLTRLDTRAIDAQTRHNQTQQGTLKDQIRASVLNEAAAFGQELRAEVKQVITREVAEAYRDVAAG